jgi:hypothetical protein
MHLGGITGKSFHFLYIKLIRSVLVKVLTILKEIIRDEEMFDMRNPAIILCDKDLEAALNMRALHVTEIRYRIFCVPATYVTIFQDLPVLSRLSAYTEMKFLDIRLSNDSSLHSIQSSFYWRILEKTML